MNRIPLGFISQKTNPTVYQLRRIKNLPRFSLNGKKAATKVFKQNITMLQKSKYPRTVVFENMNHLSSKNLSLVTKCLQKSSKFIKKAIFMSMENCHTVHKRSFILKRLFKRFYRLQTLSLINFETRYIKYCSSLQNLKLSIPEGSKTSSRLLSQVRCLQYLERVEVCLSNANQAMMALKEVQKRIKAKHCVLDITLLKPFWPCLDNIEAISQPNFKKVASVEMNLSKLPAAPALDDHQKLDLHLNFLKFLLEPLTSTKNKGNQFKDIAFPGMKLKLDPKEYDGCHKKPQPSLVMKQLEDLKFELPGSFVGSFLENCLSVYASSVFYCIKRLDVQEYLPEQNLAKLYFELSTKASAWEVLDLLRDIIEFKNIQYLYLELETKEITKSEFRAIIQEICKIPTLQFICVRSGDLALEFGNPCKLYADRIMNTAGRMLVESN